MCWARKRSNHQELPPNSCNQITRPSESWEFWYGIFLLRDTVPHINRLDLQRSVLAHAWLWLMSVSLVEFVYSVFTTNLHWKRSSFYFLLQFTIDYSHANFTISILNLQTIHYSNAIPWKESQTESVKGLKITTFSELETMTNRKKEKMSS